MSKIAPSILNADNMNLGSDIQEAIDTGIKRFHIDIMDGHFVPNLSYGPELSYTRNLIKHIAVALMADTNHHRNRECGHSAGKVV